MVIEPRNDEPPNAVSLPYRINLRSTAREHFGLCSSPAPHVVDTPRAVPLAAVILLERHAIQRPTDVERLQGAVGLMALMPHAIRFDLTKNVARAKTVEHYLGLLSHIPVLRLRFYPDFDQLNSLLNEIEAAVAAD